VIHKNIEVYHLAIERERSFWSGSGQGVLGEMTSGLAARVPHPLKRMVLSHKLPQLLT